MTGGSTSCGKALDCGAGIGRITKRLLLPIFDKVDMVEQDRHFCEKAREFIGAESSRVEHIFCSGLQEFIPTEQTYDIIWCQWVLGHLTDSDLVKFFQRCVKGLRPNGLIIIKENVVVADKRAFDDTDSSYIRTMEELAKCILDAGLTIVNEQRQKGFPKDIYPVHMFAVH